MTHYHPTVRRIGRGLVGLLVAVGLAATATAQTLQLKGGRILLGEVADADSEGLRVQRLDNGGVLDLRWDHLTPECARRVQEAHGLVAEDEGEVMVEADVVTYLSGGARLERIGRIVERQRDDIVVEKLGQRLAIPRRDISGTRRIQVPVGQIFTSEQYYVMLLAEYAPGDDADKHVQLGDALSRARDYERAEQHLLTAQELGGGRSAGVLPAMIERVRVYQKAKAERDLLDQIRVRRMRGGRDDFDKGSELIAQFEQQFPDSPLESEFERERKRFEQAQERYLVGRITAIWRRLIRPTASGWLGATDNITLAKAKEYAESQMGKDIAERVAEQLELEPAQVAELFAQRVKVDRSLKTEQYFYGIGSLVLGEQGVIKGTKQGDQGDSGLAPTEDRELERLARRLREARERSARAMRGGQGGGDAKDTPESWWDDADRGQRTSFLRAYYAEFGGDLELVKAYVKPCVHCAAKGVEETLSMEGKRVSVKCFLCQGARFTRSVVAR